MTSKIKDISQLPNWFFERKYETNISDIQWYREIRRRQFVLSYIDWLGGHLKEISKIPKICMDFLVEDISPDSKIYVILGQNTPISEITASQANYFASSFRSSSNRKGLKPYEKLLEHWSTKLEDSKKETTSNWRTKYFTQYEHRLSDIVENYDAKILGSDVNNDMDSIYNPYISYSKSIIGYPITVNTQFDDKTILKYFHEWLKEIREIEKTKAVRPFNQNDYDDWAYFKIREIFDLQTWARIKNVKILDRVIAQAVWPHAPDDFSPIDVYRTTARRKVEQIFQFKTVVRIYGQLNVEHGENFLLK